jgi:hypothetical protein
VKRAVGWRRVACRRAATGAARGQLTIPASDDGTLAALRFAAEFDSERVSAVEDSRQAPGARSRRERRSSDPGGAGTDGDLGAVRQANRCVGVVAERVRRVLRWWLERFAEALGGASSGMRCASACVCPARSRSSAPSLRWRYGRRTGSAAATPQGGDAIKSRARPSAAASDTAKAAVDRRRESQPAVVRPSRSSSPARLTSRTAPAAEGSGPTESRTRLRPLGTSRGTVHAADRRDLICLFVERPAQPDCKEVTRWPHPKGARPLPRRPTHAY